MKTCMQIMTKDPTYCLATDTVEKAAKLMKITDVGSLPVVENEHNKTLVGIITDRDLTMKVLAEHQNPQAVKVREVMSDNPVTCWADDEVQRAVELMAHYQVRRIPIVDNVNRLVGIIAQADMATRMDNLQTAAAILQEISQPTTQTSEHTR